MRLTVTLSDLENGFSVQGGAKERIANLRHIALAREPVAIHPVKNHDHKTISIIRLTDDAVDAGQRGNGIKITFRPVWVKTFLLCSMKKDDLIALVCEFDFGKYWINLEGVRETSVTTGGNGCDPKLVQQSERVLGDMIAEPIRGDILRNAISFIQRSF